MDSTGSLQAVDNDPSTAPRAGPQAQTRAEHEVRTRAEHEVRTRAEQPGQVVVISRGPRSGLALGSIGRRGSMRRAGDQLDRSTRFGAAARGRAIRGQRRNGSRARIPRATAPRRPTMGRPGIEHRPAGLWRHGPGERAVAAATPALHPPTALPVTPIRYITSTNHPTGTPLGFPATQPRRSGPDDGQSRHRSVAQRWWSPRRPDAQRAVVERSSAGRQP